MRIHKKFLLAALLVTCQLCSIQLADAALRDPGLPNQKVTPGVSNPQVTQSNIQSTICVSGFTRTIRPSVSYTNKLKHSQIEGGYNFMGDTKSSDYEEDHLIPLEVGGDPASVGNLWPQPWLTTWSAGKKDQLENKIHTLVCSGALTLAAGQKVFMTNWISGYQKYVGK